MEICVYLEGYIEDYLTVYIFTVPGTASGKFTFTKWLIYTKLEVDILLCFIQLILTLSL